MRSIDDPSSLPPDERRAEIARILAAGVLRLHARGALAGVANGKSISETSPKPFFSCLEIPDETALSVHNG